MLNLALLIFAALGSLVFSSELEPKGDTSSGTLAGHLVIGNVLKLVAKNDNKHLDEVTSKTEGYQSDQMSTDWHNKAVSKLQSLNPSVQCGGESMALRVQGSRLPNILIDRGEDDPLPLWQVPVDCGFSVKRARRDVLVVALYQGCYVVQQGAHHILPLRLWGAPVSMSCPVTSEALPVVSCLSSGMVIRMSNVSTDALRLKVNGEWLPLLLASNICGFTTAVTTDLEISAPYQSSCWQIKGDEKLLSILHEERELTISCNMVLQEPRITYRYYPHAVHHGHHHEQYSPINISTIGAPTTAAPTPVSVLFGDPKQLVSPHPPRHHFHRPYGYPWFLPTPTTASTITTKAAPTAFPSGWMQYPFPQMHYPYGPMVHHQRPMNHIYPWTIPYKATTTALPAAPPASPPKQPVYLQLDYPSGPMHPFHQAMKHGYPWVSITTPTTTTSMPSPSASDAEQAVHPFPQMHYPSGHWQGGHGHKHYGYPSPFPTKPLTPVLTTDLARDTEQPVHPFPQMHYGNPWLLPTTPAPTTVLASDPQQLVYPFPQMYCLHGFINYHQLPL